MIRFHRLILPVFSGSLAGALTVSLGAPFVAALPAALLGAVAAWLLDSDPVTVPATLPVETKDSFATALPMISTLLHAIDDPLLLVDQQIVVLANTPALNLLGTHILGQDARLAIRHPAATDRLVGLSSGADPIPLSGLGEPGRHWDLIARDLGQGRRLVRLADRTSSHAAEKMRVDFVANASHELRTPLSTLIGFIETLEGPAAEDPGTRARFLGIMGGEARRMQQLVDDLISLSRIEAEKFSLPDHAVPLAPLITEVALGAETGETPRRVHVEASDAALAVRGDPLQLSQLLHNLVGNALKYGQPDTPVIVALDQPDADTARIRVSDRGEGIAPEHLPRLTERFYRVDAGRSRSVGGTGLGLAIVKHIVERHGGRLEIRSEQGVGTTITVLLPCAPEPLS